MFNLKGTSVNKSAYLKKKWHVYFKHLIDDVHLFQKSLVPI